MLRSAILFFVFILSSFYGRAQRNVDLTKQGFTFITNTDSFFNSTLQHTKPYFLYFTASWCAPCKQLQSRTFADTTVVHYVNKNAVALKIDAATNNPLNQKYYVTEYPTIIFFDKQGNLKMRYEGFVTAEMFINILKDLEK